ncbi:MAG: DNA/RNA helicase domain-containing protein, partial [Actinomycetota bacterium]
SAAIARARVTTSASYWATDPRGFGQVGCIYTAQGFEYDFGGVIIGPDLVWREDHWESDSSEHADSVTRKAKNFDQLVRNVYKVLLTRSLRGCALLSTDQETQAMLESLIGRST